jgi:hypothetical protein
VGIPPFNALQPVLKANQEDAFLKQLWSTVSFNIFNTASIEVVPDWYTWLNAKMQVTEAPEARRISFLFVILSYYSF